MTEAHPIPGRGPVAEALRAGRALREVVVEERGSRGPGELADLAAAARAAGVSVRTGDRHLLDALSQGVLHQGVVALAPPFAYLDLAAIGETDLVVMLDGVTDPQNLGAIARSAEAAGAGALVLAKRRSAHVGPAAEKASAGALSHLPIALVPNLVRALADLRERGFWSVGLAGEAAEPLWSCGLLDGAVVLVIGSEGRGLSRLTAERVDARAAIPMAGHMESLNASAAAAVALFEVRRRRAG